MSKVLERLRKKHGYPVEINGETFYVRSLNIGELRRLDKVDSDSKTGFVIGCALCFDGTGEQELPKLIDETDAAWSERVLGELSDVATETIRALSEGISKIGMTPKAETVLKN